MVERRLIVEALPSEESLSERVTDADREAVAAFAAPRRRREYLAWRAIVYRELGPVKVEYAPCGAPRIAGCDDLHIGVSHGAGRVALCISDAPCAVDIEGLDRRFDSIASHYLTPEEERMGHDVAHFRAIAWAAKETLYKLSGRNGLRLLEDLRLTACGDGWIEGRIKQADPVRMSVRVLPDAVVVWVL